MLHLLLAARVKVCQLLNGILQVLPKGGRIGAIAGPEHCIRLAKGAQCSLLVSQPGHKVYGGAQPVLCLCHIRVWPLAFHLTAELVCFLLDLPSGKGSCRTLYSLQVCAHLVQCTLVTFLHLVLFSFQLILARLKTGKLFFHLCPLLPGIFKLPGKSADFFLQMRAGPSEPQVLPVKPDACKGSRCEQNKKCCEKRPARAPPASLASPGMVFFRILPGC